MNKSYFTHLLFTIVTLQWVYLFLFPCVNSSVSEKTLINNSAPSKYNRPHKAYDAGITDWNFTAENDLYPETKKGYPLGTEIFSSIPDTPFISHPILACQPAYNRVAYYVFTLSETAYVNFLDISARFITRVYPLDVRKDSMAILTTNPIYPCLSSSYRQICGLDSGAYTLVIFAGNKDVGVSVSPTIIVDKVGVSRFDHAQNAYNFSEVPNDGKWYNGKVGDIHPFNNNLAPSNDIIYCSAGAQINDPTDGVCNSGINESIYNSPLLYHDTVLFKGHALRNIWYTFVLSGAGKANLKINHFTGTRPLMNVYRSNVDALLPFNQLQLNGGIDSTKMDSLVLVANNFTRCDRPRNQTVDFMRSGCQPVPKRYYILVTQWEDTEPNQQVEIEIKYDGEPLPLPDILGAKPFCQNDSIFLFVAGNYDEYQWVHSQETTNGVWIKEGGLFTVNVVDTNGCSGKESILIETPSNLNSVIEVASNYNGFDISCNGFTDGIATVNPSNGIEPYQYRWNNGQNQGIINNLAADIYRVTVTDSVGCTSTNEITLTEPPPLSVDLMAFPIQCFGEKNGAISIAIAGITTPYQFSLNNSAFTANNFFENLTADSYKITITDVNQCLWEGETEIIEPDKLTLEIIPTDLELFLGDSIQLNVTTNSNGISSIRWTPNLYTSCDTCITLTIKPLSSITYAVELVDLEGCIVKDEVIIQVKTEGRIYIPNAFSPNGDRNNDRFTIFAGPEVKQIHSLIIMNRWGELLFEQNNFLPNDFTTGWDGQFKGQDVNPGIFIYNAEVEFINGRRKWYGGEFILIR